MTIPFRVKKLTKTAKAPTQENAGDLWDLYADGFCVEHLKDLWSDGKNEDFYSCFNKSIELEEVYSGDENEFNFIQENCHFKPKKSNVALTPNDCDFKYDDSGIILYPQGRILVKTGISLELPKQYRFGGLAIRENGVMTDYAAPSCEWSFDRTKSIMTAEAVAVLDIRPCSNTLEQRGLFIENKIITGGEVSFVAINHGHEPITISKGDVIAKMLIRPLYPSKMEIVKGK